MTRRDDAIEAICDAMDNHGHNGIDCRPDKPLDVTAEAALDAALAVLQPVIPNTAEALDALPVGTVIRSDDGTVAERGEHYWWATGIEHWWTADELAALSPLWYAIHTPQEPA